MDSSATNKLFVGGLSYDTTDVSLRAAFEEYGEVVSAKVITDRDTGRSRGFGFVEFVDVDAATAALDKDGKPIDGRNVKCSYAQPQAPRTGGGDRGGRPSNGGGNRW